MYYGNNTEEGIRATTIANLYLDGAASFAGALMRLQKECNMTLQQAKDFLRQAVEDEGM